MIIVDFKKESATNIPAPYPFYTGLGHLTYREEEKTLYSFGGLNSLGVNFRLKIDEMEWVQCEKNTTFAATTDLELINNASISFASLEVEALNI